MDSSNHEPSAATLDEEWVVKVLADEWMTVSRTRERVVLEPVRKRLGAGLAW